MTGKLKSPIGASYRRDLDAWVVYHDGATRIGQVDGFDENIETLDAILEFLRNEAKEGEKQ